MILVTMVTVDCHSPQYRGQFFRQCDPSVESFIMLIRNVSGGENAKTNKQTYTQTYTYIRRDNKEMDRKWKIKMLKVYNTVHNERWIFWVFTFEIELQLE